MSYVPQQQQQPGQQTQQQVGQGIPMAQMAQQPMQQMPQQQGQQFQQGQPTQQGQQMPQQQGPQFQQGQPTQQGQQFQQGQPTQQGQQFQQGQPMQQGQQFQQGQPMQQGQQMFPGQPIPPGQPAPPGQQMPQQQEPVCPPGITTSAMLFQGNEFSLLQKRSDDENIYYMKRGKKDAIGFSKADTTTGGVKVYADKAMTKEIMAISPVTGNFGKFQVTDTESGELLGYLNQNFHEKDLKDDWEIIDRNNTSLGDIENRGSFVNTLLFNLINNKYSIKLKGRSVGEISEKPNKAGHRFELDFTKDTKGDLDRRLVLAATMMMNIDEVEHLYK